jgi:hypothetical protein
MLRKGNCHHVQSTETPNTLNGRWGLPYLRLAAEFRLPPRTSLRETFGVDAPEAVQMSIGVRHSGTLTPEHRLEDEP